VGRARWWIIVEVEVCHWGVTACALEAVTLGVNLRKGGNDSRERDLYKRR